MDEFHLTGISLDVFVRWEHRTPSTTEGRGEHRGEHRVEGKPKPEQTKADGEGLVSRVRPVPVLSVRRASSDRFHCIMRRYDELICRLLLIAATCVA